MPDTTYEQAAGLIEAAEKISHLPVRVTWDDTLTVGAVLHLSEAQWSSQLRISVNPKRPDIPYLVGVQCALAIRYYEQRESKHLSSPANCVAPDQDVGFDIKAEYEEALRISKTNN